jgi:DNA-binding CsgD family transcriptional regulator
VLDLAARLAEASDPDEFADVATRGLYRLVPCDFASYNELNVERGRTVLFTEPREALRPDAEEAFARNLAQHPIAVFYAEHGGGPALRMSDFLTLRQFRRTELYDELFVPVEGNYVLAVPLPVPRGIVVGFGLVRKAPDFTDRDRSVLDLLRPHLASSYERSLLRASLGAIDDAAARGDCRLLVLDRSGGLLYVTPSAAEALRRYFGPPAGDGLPDLLEAWLRRGCTGRLSVTQNGSRLSADPVGGRPAALLLQETPLRPPVEAMRALGLTRRQAEVLALVADGRRNDEIAHALSVSPRTVKKHLESIYATLGVHTRTAAAAAAHAASWLAPAAHSAGVRSTERQDATRGAT